jgi:hypothetical protein
VNADLSQISSADFIEWLETGKLVKQNPRVHLCKLPIWTEEFTLTVKFVKPIISLGKQSLRYPDGLALRRCANRIDLPKGEQTQKVVRIGWLRI